MTFAWPQLLWLLIVPSALLAWDISHRRRMAAAARPKILRAEAGVRTLTLSTFGAAPAAKASRPRWWLWLGLSFCLVALARPQWGRIEEPVFEQSREVLLAVDLSRSMLAQDVRPSRLERSKLLIRSLLEKLAGERVGLVVFSGTAFLQSPLSSDYEILLEFLPTIGPDFLPEGGTNYRALIETSLAAFTSTANADRYLLILSDGEATDDDWKPHVDDLKKKGIKVIGLGVGTSTGSMIPDSSGGFVKDERGAVVLSKLEGGTLQALTQATGGTYRDASSWVDLAALLKETIEAGRKGQFVETNTIRLVERFQWPLALGVWFLLVSFCYEFPVRPSPRDIAVRRGTPIPPPVSRPERPGQTTAAVTAVALGIALFLMGGSKARAAAVAVDGPTAEEALGALTKVVGRLANAPDRTARDWAELGKETVIWGTGIKTSQQDMPEGPVRDALAAVDLGARMDLKATDWKNLREQLEDLLKKPEKNDQQQPGEQNQKKDQKEEKEEKQDQTKSQDDKQSGEPQSKQDQQSKDKGGKPAEPKEPGESAFGDMKDKQDQPPTPPSPPNDMQKVGGNEKRAESRDDVDPSLALPLQKLDQLRNQDSPAQLFQLMDGQKKAQKKPAKDW